MLDTKTIDKLFHEARTYNAWQDKKVEDELLQKIYNSMRFAPTSANCCPLRLTFVKSPEAKEKLKPCLMEGNIDKSMSAPITAIMANDLDFFEHMEFLFPHADVKSWYVGKPEFAAKSALLNGTLQAAYFMLAARSYGLDCGPMTGFKPKKTKEAFFPDKNVAVTMMCNIGYGDPEGLHERCPRFDFEQVCEII